MKIAAGFCLIVLLLSSTAFAGKAVDGLVSGKAAYARKDYKAALTALQPLADDGNAGAEEMLGVMYDQGQGVKQDDVKALALFQKAADQGNACAEDDLGVLAQKSPAPAAAGKKKSRAGRHNFAEASKWFLKAAQAGDAAGQYHAGRMYEEGLGVPQNWKEAMKWYRKGAGQGNAEAQDHLGTIYAIGLGTKQDLPEAYFWYSLAAASSEAYTADRDGAGQKITAAQRATVQNELKAWKPESAKP